MNRSNRRPLGLAAALLVLSPACQGTLSQPGEALEQPPGSDTPGNPHLPGTVYVPPGEAAPKRFQCDPSAVPEELPLPRLSRTQLERSLQAALRLALPAEADALWSEVASTFARYPHETRSPAPGDLRGGYTQTDQAIQQLQVDAMYATAEAMGAALTRTTARRTALLGACGTDTHTSNDRSCLEAFIGKWGARVLRRPLAGDDVTFYADIAGSTPVAAAAVADVVTALLNAPEALYRVEHGTDATQNPAPLSAFELASRLSYQLWQAPPDDALWSAAQSGALLDPAVYPAQVARLLESPEAHGPVDDFVSQWLRLEELPRMDTLGQDPVFRAFAGTELPTATTRDAMVEDVLASARHTVAAGGTLSDFLRDRRSYAQDDLLARVYGVPRWDGTSEAPLPSSARRGGLLTRAALLATGTATTRPIHKGYLVRNALLCQQLGSPPPDANIVPPTSTAQQTTREAVTERTAGGSCGGCHTTLINPPGFITEDFDALGRERTVERVFDEQGNVVAELPVNTVSAPNVTGSDPREMSDAHQLTQAIDESLLFHSCFAQQYFRFSQSRNESPSKDGCLLSSLEDAAREGKPLREVLGAVPLSATFQTKRFQ